MGEIHLQNPENILHVRASSGFLYGPALTTLSVFPRLPPSVLWTSEEIVTAMESAVRVLFVYIFYLEIHWNENNEY